MTLKVPALDEGTIRAIALELSERARGRSNPENEQLRRDIERAAFVACNSVSFRLAVAALVRNA